MATHGGLIIVSHAAAYTRGLIIDHAAGAEEEGNSRSVGTRSVMVQV